MKYIRRYSTWNDYINDFVNLREVDRCFSLVEDTDKMIGMEEEQKKTVYYKT